MRSVQYLFITLFALSLSLPAAFTALGWQTNTLGGVTGKAKAVPFTPAHFWMGSFQGPLEARFTRQLAIFAPLVKLDNQLSFWLFKQVSSNPRSKIILGNEGHLIERAYLEAFNRQRVPKRATIDKVMERLAAFQELMKRRGKAVLYLISTNKPSYYPELVPEAYRIKGAETRPNGYDLFRAAAHTRGVPLYDTKTFLQSVEQQVKVPMFAPTGTHWNQYASCRIVAEMLVRIGAQLTKPVPELACAIRGQIYDPVGADIDLLATANLLIPQSLIDPVPMVESNVVQSGIATRPKILIIGTSFSGQLMNQLNRNPRLAEREFLYYFNRQSLPQKRIDRPINKDRFDVDAAIERSDAVVLEVNESYVHRIGYGFIDRALKITSDTHSFKSEKRRVGRGR